jgi:hypothetical protein
MTLPATGRHRQVSTLKPWLYLSVSRASLLLGVLKEVSPDIDFTCWLPNPISNQQKRVLSPLG